LLIRVVKGPRFDVARHEPEILRELRKRVGDEMRLSVQYVAEIPRTASGKLRFVVSRLEGANIGQ
jgi:phenylacetate-CoA ligase